MKQVHPQLLAWLLKPLWLPVFLASGVGVWVVLSATAPLYREPDSAANAVLAEVALISIWQFVALGRSLAYVRGLGFSPRCLWAHVALSTTIASLVPWLIASLVVWTGLRSGCQHRIYNNYMYPLIAPRDMALPFLWLGYLALMLPLALYACVRAMAPRAGRANGIALAFGVIYALAFVAGSQSYPHFDLLPTVRTVAAEFVVFAIPLGLAAGRVFRRLEVWR